MDGVGGYQGATAGTGGVNRSDYDDLEKQHVQQSYAGHEQIPIAEAVPTYGYGYTQPGYSNTGESPDEYLMQGQQGVGQTMNLYIDDMDGLFRMGFIRKVFTILAIQLAITFGLILFSVFNTSMNDFLNDPERSGWFIGLGFFFLILSTIAIACCTQLTRRHPHNLILLSVYTLAQSMLLSSITVAYSVDAVMIACGTTLAIVVSLIAFASQTKYDFTGMGVYLYVGLWTLLLFGFIAAFSRSEGMQLAYAALGTLLFSFYIVYDTQLIVGGNHKVRFSVDDYVLGALILYIDIIELFMFILRLVGQSRNDN
mmetsp:Transcript_3789/g.4443  ORF Transcript_3789/g.4443 Transcript_3789/m.4443 type:complete len:312 (+) Transcript_3789:48-983(+)|eukprot:CAMPEP_0204868814 /NCGR_PEP_ID=MMETSP1348-20121228/27971_1 /ASSEMBLY_ACC=CAM_ASM_000700 /TAXON_ID=215587 /ORGANISM="Aplanochytrium stocchinoi, Strain GSBS06" /LENGTH=311 /DNA_ID=CAMNT_0052021919 /DNA_START=61 /DNA_END=996 /DNA_ORIENTATION=+